MKVLGISGFHDSSAAIIEDGKIIEYLKEERFSGIKKDLFPLIATDLSFKNHHIDYVAIISGYPESKIFAKNHLRKYNKNLEIFDYTDQHHKCHASNAFYKSGFSNALVFVIDRNGSKHYDCMRESETVFECSYPANIKTLHKNYWVQNRGVDYDSRIINAIKNLKKEDFSFNADSLMSIVKVYESATTLIGQGILENGKTMGLSSYGKDTKFIDLFNNGRPVDNLFVHGNFNDDTDSRTTLLYNHLDKITKNITEDNYQFYADYAYQVQKQTQKEVANFVENWVNKTGIKNVCITGGYGLNVVSNGNLLKLFPDINFYFDPIADDSGNSIGAAMLLYREMTGDDIIKEQSYIFLHGVKKELTNTGKNCSIRDIAKFLSEGKTVAVFNGLSESGPRALGNRSILYDARNPESKHIVNKIKKREWYRPFAGMILEEYFQEYFHTYGWKKSENMTVSFDCKKGDLIPGVIHVDNSCRVQTVNKNISHIYYLLKEFYNITQCPVLLNTSFNLAGDPLVETQEDAIHCFTNSDLHVLWFPEINKCLIKEEK